MTTPDTLAKLAACPFCGGAAKLNHMFATKFLNGEPMHVTRYFAQCECGVQGRCYDTRDADAEARAVNAWNRRALTAQAPAAEEPVAWRVRGYNQFKTGTPGPWRYFDGPIKPSVNTPDCCDMEPLSAQQAAQPPEKVRITIRVHGGETHAVDAEWQDAEIGYFVRIPGEWQAAQAPEGLSQAATDVLAERERQVSSEGWTPEHDDEHTGMELARAAACYALDVAGYSAGQSTYWPWERAAWKPDSSPRRMLIKAGALILAEIERLDRAARPQAEGA